MLAEATSNNLNTGALLYNFKETLAPSQKVNWRIEDIIGDKRLDFTKPFMPESLARVKGLSFLTRTEKRILNQIKAYTYLAIFGLVKEFILPFVLDRVRSSLDENDYRVRAFLQFTGEQAKHIQLFKAFTEEFHRNFPTGCTVIGPPAAIARKILAHQPLAVALTILHIEWMSQRHYIEAVKDSQEIDPLFKSLLKNHWLEEAQHAKLDTLMVEALAERMTETQIESAVDEYLEIVGFLDEGLEQQANFEMQSFECAMDQEYSSIRDVTVVLPVYFGCAAGYELYPHEQSEFIAVQHQANRWTYLGSGMTHPRFLETLGELSPAQRKRIEEVAPVFC